MFEPRIKAARDEAIKLKRARPEPDLRHQVKRRVAALGTPTVRGIGIGETLKVFSPGLRRRCQVPTSAAASRWRCLPCSSLTSSWTPSWPRSSA